MARRRAESTRGVTLSTGRSYFSVVAVFLFVVVVAPVRRGGGGVGFIRGVAAQQQLAAEPTTSSGGVTRDRTRAEETAVGTSAGAARRAPQRSATRGDDPPTNGTRASTSAAPLHLAARPWTTMKLPRARGEDAEEVQGTYRLTEVLRPRGVAGGDVVGRRPSLSISGEVNNAVKRPANSSTTTQDRPTTESTQDTEEKPGGGAGRGQQQRVDRVVVVERPRRLVCRWFMMQSKGRDDDDDDDDDKKMQRGVTVTAASPATPATPRAPRPAERSSVEPAAASGTDSPSTVLFEPGDGDGRQAMARRFKSWQILRLPLCREAMTELMSGKISTSSPTTARNTSSRARALGSGSSVAARLLHVMGEHGIEEEQGVADAQSSSTKTSRTSRAGSSSTSSSSTTTSAFPSTSSGSVVRSSRTSSGNNYHDEDALPSCAGHTRVDVLVAVNRASWSSSADVSHMLIAHLPRELSDASPGSPARLRSGPLRPRRSSRSKPSDERVGPSSEEDQKEEEEEEDRVDLDEDDEADDGADDEAAINHRGGNFTVVHVVSRDLERSLRLSPFPQPYPAAARHSEPGKILHLADAAAGYGRGRAAPAAVDEDMKFFASTRTTTSAAAVSNISPRVSTMSAAENEQRIKMMSIDDGFYSSYRQYCALSQRAWELANLESSTASRTADDSPDGGTSGTAGTSAAGSTTRSTSGPGAWTAFESIGESFAGRDIYALRVFTGGRDENGTPSPSSSSAVPPERRVLVLGGQHAREWISPMAVTYAAEALVAALSASSRARSTSSTSSSPQQPRAKTATTTPGAPRGVSSAALAALGRVELVFVPCVNPDGYERTYVSTADEPADRFWRKNTRPTDGGGGSGGGGGGGSCLGVDLNRNWGVAFGGEPGSSGDRCSDAYRGPEGFSEPETEAVRRFAELNPVTVALDVHSYGNVVAGEDSRQ